MKKKNKKEKEKYTKDLKASEKGVDVGSTRISYSTNYNLVYLIVRMISKVSKSGKRTRKKTLSFRATYNVLGMDGQL